MDDKQFVTDNKATEATKATAQTEAAASEATAPEAAVTVADGAADAASFEAPEAVEEAPEAEEADGDAAEASFEAPAAAEPLSADAVERAKKRRAARARRRRRQELMRGWAKAAAFVLAALILIFAVFTDVRRVADGGMSPTLMEGDFVLISRISRYVRNYARGDMVVYRDGERYMLARIVALPDETARVKGGSVYINGLLLNETGFTSGAPLESGDISAGHNVYVLLPDSREGVAAEAVEEASFVGVVKLICHPLSRAAWFPSA